MATALAVFAPLLLAVSRAPFIKARIRFGRIIPDHLPLSNIVKRVHDRSPELLYLPIKVKDVLRIIREVLKLGWIPKMMGGDGLI
jgi:hypothetical protein